MYMFDIYIFQAFSTETLTFTEMIFLILCWMTKSRCVSFLRGTCLSGVGGSRMTYILQQHSVCTDEQVLMFYPFQELYRGRCIVRRKMHCGEFKW